jgi:chromosome segregation ATPase
MSKKTVFEYQPSATLAAARRRLADLQRQQGDRPPAVLDLEEGRDAAYRRLLQVETDQLLGEASQADVAAALAELKKANDALNAVTRVHVPEQQALRDAVAHLANKIEALKDEEQQENMARWFPEYQVAMGQLDTALAQAAVANARVVELRAQAGPLASYLPGYWDQFIEHWNGTGSLYTGWRERCRRAGVLE